MLTKSIDHFFVKLRILIFQNIGKLFSVDQGILDRSELPIA